MKSIVSAALNYKSPSWKKTFLPFLLLVTLCVSCKNGQNDPSDPSAPAEYGPIEGNISKPDWKVSEDYDMSSSMTAIVKVEKLNGQTVYDKIANDKEAILAGFAGEECLGIAQADSLTGFFFLYLCEPTKEEVITLKYYSSVYKNIFVDSYAFSFVNDDKKGSVKEPYLPSLWAIKK